MFPIFTTPRFILREIQSRDVDATYKGLLDPRFMVHCGLDDAALDAGQVQLDWHCELQEEQQGLWWGICRPEAPDDLIGACGFNEWRLPHHCIELGYWLMPEFWNRGVMEECLVPIIERGFGAMAVHRVEAVVEAGNVASCRVLERLGFVHEGTRRECRLRRGRYSSLECYGLLRREWRP